MGKFYTAYFQNGTERIAADMSTGRAKLFYEMTLLVEPYVQLPSGVADDNGQDEHPVEAEAFLQFFERFWEIGWLGEKHGLFHIWAQYAAGMVENISLEPREWVDRCGKRLSVLRSAGSGE